MGGSVKKITNSIGNFVEKTVGKVGYQILKAGTGISLAEGAMKGIGGDWDAAKGNLLNAATGGISGAIQASLPQKPELEGAASEDHKALIGAMLDEETNRRKKRGFAANVFGADFRMGGNNFKMGGK